jgi:hypothetical protein
LTVALVVVFILQQREKSSSDCPEDNIHVVRLAIISTQRDGRQVFTFVGTVKDKWCECDLHNGTSSH